MKVKNPDYINFMNAGLHPASIPSDESVWCNACHDYRYVNEAEMQFLKENRHIVSNQVNCAHAPEISPSDINNPDAIPDPYMAFEYDYVSRFCPHCERKKFGEHSDWRE